MSVAAQGAKSIGNYVIPNRITLYGMSNLITRGDIRRAYGDKLKGVMDVQIDYKAFRPSGKAIITMSRPEFVPGNLHSLKPFTVCGHELHAVAQYASEPSNAPRTRGIRGLTQAVERGIINGNGPDGSFANIERSVVLWGLPGKTTAEEVGRALLADFKPEKKNGKPVVIKLERIDGKFTLFSRFVVTMSSVSEARRLARAWHLTPWLTNSPDAIRAQVLF
ncbi:hypothetical protein H0H87_004998 [Tephrocybe sp. NHM501043]|nr:hypothetical protein H0H87_004998 [Tephrocybe sp. NHM501043]